MTRCGWSAGPWRRVVWLLVVMLLGTLAACSVGWPGVGPREETRPVLTETAQLVAVVAPPPGTRAIDEATARRTALAAMSRADAATAVRARQALFSLRETDGTVTMQPRHTWLITYEGVTFTASTTCSCHIESQPNTTIVLDAVDGRLLTVYGSADAL